jgi:hypothetical protein
MDLTRLLGSVEIVVPVLAFVAFSLQKWKTGMRDAWRNEAEAYKARAERLDEEIKILVAEVKALRDENRTLREQIAELLSR